MSAAGFVPPQDLQAERAVLGSILLDNSALASVVDVVRVEDFYRDGHRKVYLALLELIGAGTTADSVTLWQALKVRGTVDQVGGPEYIARLAEEVPTPISAGHYAKIVLEKAQLRRAIAIGTELVDRARRDDVSDLGEFLASVAGDVAALQQQTVAAGGLTSVRELVLAVMGDLELANRPEQEDTPAAGRPVASGFTDLDQLLVGGFRGTDLVVLAARPSMGKTALALNVAVHAAVRDHVPTAVFSLEMSSKQLIIRALSTEARVSSARMKSGHLGEDDWSEVFRAAELISPAPLWIDDTPSLRVTELRARCRKLKAKHGLGLVVVDYLQLLRGPERSPNREQEVAEISRSLKALAKELDVPVIALSQLNRELEKRKNRRPILADLRESGAIEQDADLVLFVYRDEVYFAGSKDAGTAEIIIGKHRNGELGQVRLAFQGQFTRFSGLARSY